MTGGSNNGANFPHRLLLNDTQVSRLRKDFTNGLSASIKLSKTQLSKMVQFGGYIFNLMLGPFNSFKN